MIEQAVRHAIHWFDLRTADFDRAVRFYEAILEAPLHVAPYMGERIAIFPHAGDAGVTGSLVERSAHVPGCGARVYLNATARLERTLSLVTEAGGKIVVPIYELPGGNGRAAVFVDPEGNHVGLHAEA